MNRGGLVGTSNRSGLSGGCGPGHSRAQGARQALHGCTAARLHPVSAAGPLCRHRSAGRSSWWPRRTAAPAAPDVTPDALLLLPLLAAASGTELLVPASSPVNCKATRAAARGVRATLVMLIGIVINLISKCILSSDKTRVLCSLLCVTVLWV